MAGQDSQTNKSCACCKRYTDHLDGKMKCFLIRMTANFRHGMTVPERFINHFGGSISQIIELESPTDNVYDVGVTKHTSKMVVQGGWEAFVDAHHIKENDTLLFQHTEKCRFGVLILDADGCEKVFPCGGINRSSNAHGRRGIDKSPGVRKRFATCTRERGSPSRPRKTAFMVLTSSSEESGQNTESPSEYESSFELHDESPFELHDDQTHKTDYILARRDILSEQQEEKVAKLVQEIRPEIPVLVAIIKRSNVRQRSPYLAIPKHYGAPHFPAKSQIVTLQRAGKNYKWHIQFDITKDRSSRLFTGRWVHFIRDNHLREGDICIFQPVKSAATMFTVIVHLLRKSKDYSLGGIGNHVKGESSSNGQKRTKVDEPKRVSCQGKPSENVKSTIHVKEEPIDGEDSSSGCNKCHRHQLRPLESSDSDGAPECPYILSGRTNLTQEQQKKLEERVLSIPSEVPIYAAKMRKSSSSACVLVFGKRYSTQYLPNREQTMTLLREGKSNTWRVKMIPMSGGSQKKLTIGWRDFVRDNRIQVDDICLFQLMKNQKRLAMTIYIIRHGEEYC